MKLGMADNKRLERTGRSRPLSRPAIIYGATIRPATFKVVLNRIDITSSFMPSPGTSETVEIPLSPGQRNVLVFTVDGELSTGRVATDRDRLTFVVP